MVAAPEAGWGAGGAGGTGFDPFALNGGAGGAGVAKKKEPHEMTDDEIQAIENPIEKLNAIMAKKLKLKEAEEKKQQQDLQTAKAGVFNSVGSLGVTQMIPGMMAPGGYPGMMPGAGAYPFYAPVMPQPPPAAAPGGFPAGSPLDIFNQPGFMGGHQPAPQPSAPGGFPLAGAGFPAAQPAPSYLG